jgi:hypothetical protein
VSTAESALAAALPAGDLRSDRDFRLAVFTLARHLKAVQELRDRPASALRPLVQEWHQQAGARLGGHTFTDTYAEFVGVWKGVRFAAGDDVVKLAWEVSGTQPPPPEAAHYDDPRVGRLIGLCRQLQHENEVTGRRAGFALSGYVAGKLLKVCQRTAAAWLAMLVEDGVLEVVDVGGGFRGGRRLAREYRLVDPT